MVDLLVTGLDLGTGLEVHAGDRQSWEWHSKGHNGDRTLVCLQCYASADVPGGPRVVALVPKGRRGGRRRQHFAHPPGMAPPGGRHGREGAWHAEGKQRMRRWAETRGARARVEAWTPDRRRRSDVAVTLPDCRRVAIEVELGAVSDAEWLARHRDYARAGIADVWLWHEATWVPRVLFDAGQPGWILDLGNDRLGLLHAQPCPVTGASQPDPPGCGQVHWPPCCGDQLDTVWMPLASVQLTPGGISPLPTAAAEIARRAAKAAATVARAARPAPAGMRRDQDPWRRPVVPAISSLGRGTGDGAIHQVFRYDARPPWTDPDTWWYLCDECGRSRISGAELNASPVSHIVATPEQLTSAGRPLVSYVRHGGVIAQADEEAPADQIGLDRPH